MRVFLLLVCSAMSAEACCPPAVVYYEVRYWQPTYWVPMVYWADPCCPVVPLAPPVVHSQPPLPMPKKEAKAETPYAPITPAAAEEKMPLPSTVEKKVETPMIPKVEPKLDIPMPKDPPPAKIELPSSLPSSTPKIELPPLDLKKSTSNYRAAVNAEKWHVAGEPPASGQYRISLFNFSDRAVDVAVNGAAMTLPPRTTITANVAKTFALKVNDGEAESVTIERASVDVIVK